MAASPQEQELRTTVEALTAEDHEDIAEMMDDEQVKAIGIMQPEPGSGVSYVGMPFNVNGERPQIRKVASTLEEATQARAQVETAVAAGESPFEKLFG